MENTYGSPVVSRSGGASSAPVTTGGAAQSDGVSECAGSAIGEVLRFAADVVARLVAKDAEVGADVRRGFFDYFLTVVTEDDPVSFEALRAEMRRARVTPEMLADEFIPDVARRLGEMWHRDEATFAKVSIGSARLQAILHDISHDWRADSLHGSGAGTVLLVLPLGEQHTLGACVLAAQLRRRGVSVCVCIGPDVGDLRRLVLRRHFDAAMLSLGAHENLDICCNFVETIREGSGNDVRIAVGGAILESETDIAARLGVDVATQDLEVALAALGLDGGAKAARPTV